MFQGKKKDRQATLEAERERLEAKKEKLEREANIELKKFKFKSEQRKMEFEEKRMQLELEKLRLEQKTNCSTGEGGKANQAGSARVVFEGARYPDFPPFINNRKDDLDNYLLRFERYDIVANWPQANWQLS